MGHLAIYEVGYLEWDTRLYGVGHSELDNWPYIQSGAFRVVHPVILSMVFVVGPTVYRVHVTIQSRAPQTTRFR